MDKASRATIAGFCMENGQGSRIPVKVHRRVCVIRSEDPAVIEEILSRKKLQNEIAGRLTASSVLVKPGRTEPIIAELLKLGHTPKIVQRAQ